MNFTVSTELLRLFKHLVSRFYIEEKKLKKFFFIDYSLSSPVF